MRLVLLVLLLLPFQVDAAPVLAIVGSYLAAGTGWAAVLGWVLMIGSSVYGSNQAKKLAAQQRDEQRRAYNAGLRDRTITRVATDAPWRYVYGRARVGSDIVAMFTGGTRDEYKYLVCVHAAHECDAIEEVYVDGRALGTLTSPAADGSQAVTAGDYLLTTIASIDSESHTGTAFTLDHIPVTGSLRVTYEYGPVDDYGDRSVAEVTYTLTGADVTVTTSHDYLCHYDYAIGTPRVRVTKHLGTSSDTVDLSLNALPLTAPGWPTTAVLRDFCYTVIRLDLTQPEFQSGIPAVEVLMRGKKLFDPRDLSTIWSSNPVLAARDYLLSPMCGVLAADLPDADYITAANVCDETITVNGGSEAKYTINGTVTADQDPRKVLESMAQCMAGSIVATTWSISAGKYVAPVLTLDQSDIVGSLAVVGGAPDADLYNGIRGQYISPENAYVVTDFEPFQNAAYVAADGRELWNGLEFPFTDGVQRLHNLCRIFTEDQRNGFTIRATFSLKTWSLQIGQRVSFTSTFLGQTSKVYRLTDKRFGIDQAVELTLKEDAASIWDVSDVVTVESTPNTNLPNPFIVGLCGDVQISESLYETTGSAGVKAKATLTWTAPADVSVIDYEVEYKRRTSGVWIELFNVRGTEFDFLDIAPGSYDFRVKARNILGAVGEYTAIKTFTIYGLTTAPGNVSGFTVKPFNGSALVTWDRTTDLDVKIGGDIIIRFSPLTTGASWVKSVILPDGKFNGDATTAIVPLATGTYYAKFKDSTGHYSDTEASFVVTEAILTGWTTVATIIEHTLFAGVKTNVILDGAVIKLDGTTLIDDMITIDSVGYIDSVGGMVATGTYAFASTLDLTTVANRRFHASVLALSYNADDLIDSRLDLIDSWVDIDGATVNDCTATVYVSISDDNITYSSFVAFMVADFSCRYAKFKIVLTSGDTTHNIDVSQLTVTVKVPT